MIRPSERMNEFELLKIKLKAVISECSEKTLIRVDTGNVNSEIPISWYFSGATRGEQHVLENGLYVYIFYSGDNPINYLFSSKPFFEDYEFINPHYGTKYINKKYNNVTGLEFTFGGKGNSIPLDGTDCFYGEQVGIIGPVQNNGFKALEKYMAIVPNEEGKLVFKSSLRGKGEQGSFVYYEKSDELTQYQKSCDLEGFITNCRPEDSYGQSQIDELRRCLSMINEIYWKNMKSKKGKEELKGLLAIVDALDNKLDGFGSKHEL